MARKDLQELKAEVVEVLIRHDAVIHTAEDRDHVVRQVAQLDRFTLELLLRKLGSDDKDITLGR